MGNIYSSSTEACPSDSESDPWELDEVKLRPYLSTFLQESQENADRLKVNRPRLEYQSVVTLGDEYVDRAASTLLDKSNLPDYQQEYISGRYLQSMKDPQPTAFKTGCLLPEFPELRDSYDQFCTTLSANSSNEDLEINRSSLKYQNASETRLSRCPSKDLLDDAHLACKRRKKTILQEASDAHEKYQRWSMPEFTKLWYEIADSDVDSEVTGTAASSNENFNKIPEYSREKYFHQLAVSTNTYTDLEQQISGHVTESNDKILVQNKLTNTECASCPNILCHEVPSASSSCCDSLPVNSNHDDFVTSTPEQGNILLNYTTSTTPESEDSRTSSGNKGCPHLSYVDEPSDRHNNIMGGSSSNCEASVCTSDSGYSGMSNGSADSGEGEEQCHICEKEHSVCLNKPKLHRAFKDFRKNSADELCDDEEDDHDYRINYNEHDSGVDDERTREIPIDYPSNYPVTSHTSSYPDVVVERSISEVRRNRHCAQLVKEFRIIKNLNPGSTCSHNYSLYRTYEV